MAIHLTPGTESALAREAEARGTTPDVLAEEYVVEAMQRAKPEPAADGAEAKSLADFLSGYVGVFDSRDDVPGGARLSEEAGKKFAEGMVRKRAQGHL